jgi:hypothetical protein
MEKKINNQGKPIKLKAVTIDKLDKLKHKGQSYDGIITELIDHYNDEKGRKR